MARARLLKPGFFNNEDLCELPMGARLLFAGLWTIADRDGRLDDRPKRIKAELFPYDNVKVPAFLDALEAKGFIQRYIIGEAHFIQIVNWGKHQHPHVKEPESVIPGPVPALDQTGARTAFSGTDPADTETESVTEAESEAKAETDAELRGGVETGIAIARVLTGADAVASAFASFGKVTAGTPQGIDYAIDDYGLEWTEHAVKVASGASFDDRPPWGYVQSILERWKAQGHPDEPEVKNGRSGQTRQPARSGTRNGARADDDVESAWRLEAARQG